jgi:hypothetical protein
MLRLNSCDRVTQKASTVTSIVLGSLKPVVGSDRLNVLLLAIDGGRYDTFSRLGNSRRARRNNWCMLRERTGRIKSGTKNARG